MKKYRIILVIIFYLAILGVLFFLINKIVSMINQTNDDMQKQEIIQESKYKQIDEIPKKQQQFDEISSQKGKLQEMILKREDAVKLIEQFENLAAQSKVQITIDVQENKADPKLKTPPVTKKGEVAPKTLDDFLPDKNYLKFTVDISGNYNDVFTFFSKIENMPYYSDVLSFDIKLNDETTVITSSTIDPFGNASANNGDGLKNVVPSSPKAGDILGSFVIAFYIK